MLPCQIGDTFQIRVSFNEICFLRSEMVKDFNDNTGVEHES